MRKRLNDSEMSLFASVVSVFDVPVKDVCGRGNADLDKTYYGTPIRKCRYTVFTRFLTNNYARSFKAVLRGMFGAGQTLKSASADVLTKYGTMQGLGLMTIRLNKNDGTAIEFDVSQADARNLAQMLNAAANSCNATWRKSSITS